MTITPPDVLAELRAQIPNASPGQAAAILAILDHVAALTLALHNSEARDANARALADTARRSIAESHQVRVAADAVSKNADDRVRVMWRQYGETRALLVGVLLAFDALPDPVKHLSDEHTRVIRAAKEAMRVVDLGPPAETLDTT